MERGCLKLSFPGLLYRKFRSDLKVSRLGVTVWILSRVFPRNFSRQVQSPPWPLIPLEVDAISSAVSAALHAKQRLAGVCERRPSGQTWLACRVCPGCRVVPSGGEIVTRVCLLL